eukprot:TRINITY_DN35868_c0_g1_i1.p1 TRINITY_DN35868_c0_g1~~TRINITY_DN35868_c0_g1_i1.p1  ORF type:complete len:491 (-),score=87.60 TRINITY_DN35868_c0_g1_i1:101-1573(-)
MAPILSKAALPSKLRQSDAEKIAVQRAKPLLESLLKIVEATIQTGGVVVNEVKYAAQNIGSLVDKAMHQSARLLQACCCMDLQKFTRGPEKPSLTNQLPVMFVVMILAMLYNAFVFCYLPAAGFSFFSAPSLIFHAFVFLTLASFAQACRTDPGGIPEGPEWRDQSRPPKAATEQKKFSEAPRWCRKSNAYKPDRSHFSRGVDRVVLRMDHHCPWLNNTVGWGNHKFFYLFLAYTNTACAILGISVFELLIKATLPALTTFLLIGAETLTLILTSILLPFFLWHTWLLARNMTTIEFCASFQTSEDGNSPPENPYDLGIYRNICSVMGSSPLIWWAPVGGPEGDGISFPRSGMTQPSSKPGEQEEADPEAAHPAGPSTGDAEEGMVLLEREEDDLCSFFVWTDAAEFTDDLRVGCEVIVESMEDAALSMLSLCRSRRKRRKSAVGSRAVRPSREMHRIRPRPSGGVLSDYSSETASSVSWLSEEGEAFLF